MNLKSLFRSIVVGAALISMMGSTGCGGAGSSGGDKRTGDSTPSSGNYIWQSGGGPSLFISTLDSNGGVSTATNAGNPSSPVVPRVEYPSFAAGSLNHFFYAMDTSLNAVRVFSMLGPGVTLTELKASPFTTGSTWSMRVNSTETFLYLMKGTEIEVLSISSKGVLAHASAVTGLGDVREAAITPSGKFLFANDVSGWRIHGFEIGSDGSLTPIQGSPFSMGAGPRHIVIDSSGRYLYAGITYGGIAAFTIDATSGALTAVSDSPFSTSNAPTGMATTSSYVYVSTQNGSVDGFKIGSDGALTQVPGSPFGSGTSSTSIAVDSTGQYVYVANGSTSLIYGLKIDSSTGRLTSIGGSPFAAVPGVSHLVPMRIP